MSKIKKIKLPPITDKKGWKQVEMDDGKIILVLSSVPDNIARSNYNIQKKEP